MEQRLKLATAVDLLLMADMDRLWRAQCYARLCRETATMGEFQLADIFDGLAQQSFALVPRPLVESDASQVGDGQPDDELGMRCDASLFRTPYDAWSAAVAMERHAEHKLISLLSRATDPAVRNVLRERIHACHERSAAHRVHRRAAFHSDQLGALRAGFPDVRRIYDASDLQLVSLAIEKWFLHHLATEGGAPGSGILEIRLGETYESAIALTRATVEHLEHLTVGRAPPRRLGKWIDALNAHAGAVGDADTLKHFHHLKLAAEAARIFDYYDHVFEDTEDADIMALAQDLSERALKRLSVLRTSAAA